MQCLARARGLPRIGWHLYCLHVSAAHLPLAHRRHLFNNSLARDPRLLCVTAKPNKFCSQLTPDFQLPTSSRTKLTAHSSQLTAHKFCLSPDISKLGHVTRVWFCRLSLARHVFGCAFCGSFCRDASCVLRVCLSPDISKLGHVTRVWFCRLSLARHVFGCAFCGSFCRDATRLMLIICHSLVIGRSIRLYDC